MSTSRWPFIAMLVLMAHAASAEEFTPVSLEVPPGYSVELAAAPPLVGHPMMADFDDQGRLYVAANVGENLPRAELEKRLPNFVQRLEDTDGDGVFDKATLFADKMTFPQGCLWHEGSLYVASSGAIWKLTDTNDDGIADERVKLVGDFGYTGNAADIHGPFLGPEGRIYWCEGRHGHEIRDAEGNLISQGKAARIFSCRTDGTDVQTFATGGMDNPVEIVFTPAGEMLGTVNLMYAQPRGDCLVHWQYGGVYPREDFAESLEGEFVRTGPLLPEVVNFGHVAVSGLCRREGTLWGAETEGDIFVTEFNTNRVVRVRLAPHGSTFTVDEQEDFAVSSSTDFRPTDVLQAPDGSLLVIDTGGWFRIGCPQSGVAKSHIRGAIYRIRKDATEAPSDTATPTPTQLAQQQIWELRRQETPQALAKLAPFLEADEPMVRQTAARALLDWPPTSGRSEMIPRLVKLATSGTPSERRVSLATLSHWKVSDEAYLPALLTALDKPDNDILVEHAAVLALIKSGQRSRLRDVLLDPRERVAHGAAVALDQLQRPLVQPDQADWLEIPAASLGQPLSEAQRETLLSLERELPSGDPEAGKKIFVSQQATCSKCHRVAGEGGLVGPDLTTIGRSRARRDLLESVVFPSATFARGFAPYMVATEEGKTYSGIILGEGSSSLKLGLDHENSATVPNASIVDIRSSDTSIMPADIHRTLTLAQLADLLAYLQSLK